MSKLLILLVTFFGIQFCYSQNTVLDTLPEDSIYSTVGIDVKPEYPGGVNEFYKFVSKKYRPPSDKYFKGGKLIVSFVIEKDGSYSNIKIIKDLGFGSGEEAIRVLKLCKNWIPGEQNGQKVRCSYMLPIQLGKN